MSEASGADAYCALLERLTADNLDKLDSVVAEDVRFKDPFNDVTGIENMRAVLADMFEHVSDIRFNIRDRMDAERVTLITWTLQGRLLGKPWSVDGASRLAFGDDGLLREHVDYWDAAEGLYERLPIIGWLPRALRRRLRIRPVDSPPGH